MSDVWIKRISPYVVFLGTFLCATAADPFPKLQELPPGVAYPKHAAAGIDRAGNFIVNGKARYLLGTQVEEYSQAVDFAPTPGYPAELKWMYEQPLSYENVQRIGFDTFAVFLSYRPWLEKYKPGYFKDKTFGFSPKDLEFHRIFFSNGLPLLIDFTCFPWTYGSLADRKAYKGCIPEEWLNQDRARGQNHWVPYNIFHPQARNLYLEYWKRGFEVMSKRPGMNTLVYELFNEPGYDDFSAYNRNLFARRLAERYKTVSAMNRIWKSRYASFEQAAAFKRKNENPGLFVDWSKFMESGMTELARSGAEMFRKQDPRILMSYQPLSSYRVLSTANVNVYEVNRHMNVVSTMTGGGITTNSSVTSAPRHAVESPSHIAIADGILIGRFFQSIADGKPIINPECYALKDRPGNRNVIWQDLLRGRDATYLYFWSKRAWDWKPYGTAEGGKRSAEHIAYNLANPYAYSADALAGFMDAKKEIVRFGDFFIPRENRIAPEIALMISYPTERYAIPTAYVVKNQILHYAAGLEFSCLPWGVVLEEQLMERVLEKKKYKVLIAAGVRNTRPETLPAVEEYVRGGGTLIAACEFLPQDEYGHPVKSALFDGIESSDVENPEHAPLSFRDSPPVPGVRIMVRNGKVIRSARGWETLASVGNTPAVLRRKFGRGSVILITPQMQDYAVAAVLRHLLGKEGISPNLVLERIPQGDMAVNIETHCAKRSGVMLAHLMNLDQYPKRTRVRLPKDAECVADLLRGELLPCENGAAEFLVDDNAYTILGFGKRTDLERLFGPLSTFSPEKRKAYFADAEKRHEEKSQRRNAGKFTYHIDSSMTTPLNLRPFANAGFVDKIANDHQGGWTDQGVENSLTGTPWEVKNLCGVPCDFIRFDQNNDKTCIVLSSPSMSRPMPKEVRGIPVNSKVRRLFFFHTLAWRTENQKVMEYVVHYASGATRTIPILSRRDIDDWWLAGGMTGKHCRIAWQNSDRRGFYLCEWRNPEPETEIKSIDIVSGHGKSIPIVIGITAEKIADSAHELNLHQAKVIPWGGIKVLATDQDFELKINEKTNAWAGVAVRFDRPIPLTPEQWEKAVLKFEFNGGTDSFGNPQGGQRMQMTLSAKDGKASCRKLMMDRPDGFKDTFEPVSIPCRRFFEGLKNPPKNLDSVIFQFYGTGSHSGIQFRNMRIEY